jgi:hypothetical protein
LVACALLTLGAAPPPHPVAPKSTKHASVYNLAYAGAILDICAASPAHADDAARSKEIGELSARLSALVNLMSGYYRDAELATLYDSTRKELAGDEKLRKRVRVVRGDCGERSLGEMRAYVSDNEAMITKGIEAAKSPKRAPPGK